MAADAIYMGPQFYSMDLCVYGFFCPCCSVTYLKHYSFLKICECLTIMYVHVPLKARKGCHSP